MTWLADGGVSCSQRPSFSWPCSIFLFHYIFLWAVLLWATTCFPAATEVDRCSRVHRSRDSPASRPIRAPCVSSLPMPWSFSHCIIFFLLFSLTATERFGQLHLLALHTHYYQRKCAGCSQWCNYVLRFPPSGSFLFLFCSCKHYILLRVISMLILLL